MAVVWTGLRLLPFSTLRRILDHYAGSPTAGNIGQPRGTHKVTRGRHEAKGRRQNENGVRLIAIGTVRWAITAVAARFPSATCLVQALAADAILRRRGLACELHIGVRVRGNTAVPLEAHAWVECDGAVAIGAIENLSDYKALTALRSQ